MPNPISLKYSFGNFPHKTMMIIGKDKNLSLRATEHVRSGLHPKVDPNIEYLSRQISTLRETGDVQTKRFGKTINIPSILASITGGASATVGKSGFKPSIDVSALIKGKGLDISGKFTRAGGVTGFSGAFQADIKGVKVRGAYERSGEESLLRGDISKTIKGFKLTGGYTKFSGVGTYTGGISRQVKGIDIFGKVKKQTHQPTSYEIGAKHRGFGLKYGSQTGFGLQFSKFL